MIIQKKKIVALTGSRSEYDILFSVLKKLNEDEFFHLFIVVSGAHLCENFGYTINEIEQDGFKIAARIHNLINSDKPIGKAKGSGFLLTGLSDILNDLKPDYVMVAGDREETIIAGIACTYLGIPLIHLAGGDRTYPGATLGDVDEQIRHATSKLASIHFVFAKEHEKRLIRMGEEPWRVCYSGNPALDRFKEIPQKSKKEMANYLGFEDYKKSLVLVIQHVISSEYESGANQIDITLKGLKDFDINVVVNYPNSDIGSRKIIDVIENFRKTGNYRITKNIPRNYFVNLLRNANCLIGNSSLAFLEGSYLSLPAINVGSRQKERLHGGNVVFVDHDEMQIREALRKILFDSNYRAKLKSCEQIYGDGKASEKIVSFLRELNMTKEQLVAKDLTY